jgi:uncharacterized protein involved in cysteine biosynthesis
LAAGRAGTFTFVEEGEQRGRHPETGRAETDKERVDRNLQEMLGELRVALPGVQVLFAFLLVVPFNQRFGQVTGFQKTLYLITLLFTTASSICLIAPSAHHRLEFRRQDKEAIVQTGNRIVVVGMLLLAIAMTGAVLFVTDVIYGTTTTIAAAGGVALAFAVIWYAIPLRRLSSGR